MAINKNLNILNISALTFTHLTVPLAYWYWNPRSIVIGLVVLAITGLGVTVGYHRLLTHRSFQTHPWLKRLLATLGLLALQRGPVDWVAIHRMHHAFTDTPKDPHNARQGFWYAHGNWLWRRSFDPSLIHPYARDMLADPYLRWINNQTVGLAINFVFYGLLWLVFDFAAVVWAGSVRLFVQYHSTFAVNSAAHRFGYRNYQTNDLSTNCWWVALFTFGEGWHNNHHYNEQSAAHGHKAHEFDISWQLIKLLGHLGLAWNIKVAKEVEDPGYAAQTV